MLKIQLPTKSIVKRIESKKLPKIAILINPITSNIIIKLYLEFQNGILESKNNECLIKLLKLADQKEVDNLDFKLYMLRLQNEDHINSSRVSPRYIKSLLESNQATLLVLDNQIVGSCLNHTQSYQNKVFTEVGTVWIHPRFRFSEIHSSHPFDIMFKAHLNKISPNTTQYMITKNPRMEKKILAVPGWEKLHPDQYNRMPDEIIQKVTGENHEKNIFIKNDTE